MPGHKSGKHDKKPSGEGSSHASFPDFELICGAARFGANSEVTWCTLLGVEPKSEDWQGFIVYDANGVSLLSCAVSLRHRAYVVLSVDLLNNDAECTRKTEMRLYQMIIAGYTHAGGAPEDLRYVVFLDVSNSTVRAAMDAQFKKDGYPSAAPSISTEPDPDPGRKISRHNLFIQSSKNVGQGVGKVIKRIHLLRDYGVYHIIIRLG